MTTTDEVRTVYAECGGDLEQVAVRLGIPYAEIASLQEVDFSPTPTRRRAPPADLGVDLPPDRKYIVSRRHSDNPVWPREDQKKIEEARAAYEAGTHEIVTGRDRGWLLLYCIPRATRAGARKFFQPN